MDLGSVSASLGLVLKNRSISCAQTMTRQAWRRVCSLPGRSLHGFNAVQDLAWLKKCDRASALAAFVGGMLNIKPIIRLKDARFVPRAKMRGKKPALKRLVGMAAERYRRLNGQCDVWLAYIDNLDEAMTTREKLAPRLSCPIERINLAEVGATISVHTGPGAICIAMSPAFVTSVPNQSIPHCCIKKMAKGLENLMGKEQAADRSAVR